MSTTMYSLSLARSANGNWSLTPSDNLAHHALHPFPPMAFPADMSQAAALAYAASLLQTARVPAPALPLDWHQYGYTYPTIPSGQQCGPASPAYRVSWSVSVQSLSPKGA